MLEITSREVRTPHDNPVTLSEKLFNYFLRDEDVQVEEIAQELRVAIADNRTKVLNGIKDYFVEDYFTDFFKELYSTHKMEDLNEIDKIFAQELEMMRERRPVVTKNVIEEISLPGKHVIGITILVWSVNWLLNRLESQIMELDMAKLIESIIEFLVRLI